MWSFDNFVRAMYASKSNLNAGWTTGCMTVEDLIDFCLTEPEGGIIGTAEGERLRQMVEGV